MKVSHATNARNRLLAVDPGVTGTGWALLDPRTEGLIVGLGTISAPEKGEWIDRVGNIVESFDSLLASTPVDRIVAEGPMFMSGFGGFTVAVTGDLCKLAMLTGGLIRVAQARGIPILLATPHEWKGQMSKGATRIRVEHVLGRAIPGRTTSHSRDALGIGLWALGKF